MEEVGNLVDEARKEKVGLSDAEEQENVRECLVTPLCGGLRVSVL